MKALSLPVLMVALLTVSGTALADDAALLKCRTLSDTASRVACYDAIPVGIAGPAAATGTAAAAPVRTPEQNFGMEAVKQREAQPASIRSTVVGDFDGWGPGSQIRLANGQVWRVIDGSDAVLPPTKDAAVTIERNVFGTLFLKVDGGNSSAKVRRVQ
ncbi:hypothetical protein HD842_001408 [Massilia aurea]|uniref:Uncharacterized protein n=1 Tax=Massilia aurea TaxID=373040 RepID=A0A7W9WYQ7_9BURK|nr:hypothetical protein [Massilia aurea]MBB6133297.1 hypothetical protein [Massilia aurea]